ncbi:hypothetical protein [Frigoriglobus tundricola]|uniref:Uncharacterized protein n=1 Tax=Frigoriglobus tundricola TaxID=2774151 RepID=A0A6M5Z3J9_9BACT|nr:hypothetical protein [Frigoriglobus tundricola]QJX01000.1 hypothetical protein FTUN_8638 [Frigoriglobus tundricola]
MRVEFDCPLCHRAVHAPPALEGTSFPCPSCAGNVPSWPAPNASSQPLAYFNFPCQMCGIVVAAELAQVGATARCSTCGSQIIVPPPPPEPPPADPVQVPIPELRPAPAVPVPPPPPLRSPGKAIMAPAVRLPRLDEVTRWVIAWGGGSLFGIGFLWAKLGVLATVFGPLVASAVVFGLAGIHYGQTPCYRCGSRWAGRRWDPVRTEWGRERADAPSPYRCSQCGTRI